MYRYTHRNVSYMDGDRAGPRGRSPRAGVVHAQAADAACSSHGAGAAVRPGWPLRPSWGCWWRRGRGSRPGRCGRSTDPEWKARRRLLRNREDLTDEQFAKMWNPLLDEGKIGWTLVTAWIAGKPAHPPRSGPHRRGPPPHRPGPLQIPHLVRGRRHPGNAYPRHHRGPLVERDRRVHRHRTQQRQKRGRQPRHQACRPRRLRVPQRYEPAATHTLRHDSPGPRTPPHRSPPGPDTARRSSSASTHHVPAPDREGDHPAGNCPILTRRR